MSPSDHTVYFLAIVIYAVTSSGDCNELSLTIQPQAVSESGAIIISCTFTNARDTQDPLLLSPPNSNHDCTSDCFVVDSSTCGFTPENCKCDTFDPDMNGICPAGTKGVSFVVSGVTLDMAGDWKCESYFDQKQDTFHLNVYKISDDPTLTGNFNATVNSVEAITCSSKGGSPPAQFEWFIDDGNSEIDVTYNSTTADGESVLWYTAQRLHHGSDIVCRVTQEGLPDERCQRNLLTVMYSPLKASSNNSEVITALNESTTLECFVEADDRGYPDEYTYIWKRNKDTSFNETTATGSIVILPYHLDFEDIYSCYPKNIVGTGLPADINLKLKVSPEIDLLHVSENTTSTTISLCWFLNSTGGSNTLLFHVWYACNDCEWVSERLANYGKDGDNICCDIIGLQPNTSYYFMVTAKDQLDGLYSQNETTIGNTKASPLINLHDASVQSNLLVVLWDYSFTEDLLQIEVTLRIEYWAGAKDSVFYPSADICDIPVNMRAAIIPGKFQPGVMYEIKLHIHENGYPGSTSGNQYLMRSYSSAGFPTVSDIVAIVTAVLFLVLLVLFSTMVYLGHISIIPLKRCREDMNHKEDKYKDTRAMNEAYEIPNKQENSTQQLESQTYAQLEEYTNHETIVE